MVEAFRVRLEGKIVGSLTQRERLRMGVRRGSGAGT
jgi:hypothetical protein